MGIFKGFSQNTKKKNVVDLLIKQSRTNLSYFFLLSIAAVITTIGLSLDNLGVIIGGMLIAPLLTPILALGLGLTTVSPMAIVRSLQGIVTSAVFIIFWAFLVSSLVHTEGNYLTTEILSRGEYTDLYFIIAFLSGLGATFAWMEPMISSALPGVAVAVSLVPPVCVTGIALAQGNRELMFNSFNLFAINTGGIILASILVFAIFRFSGLKKFQEQQMGRES